MRHLSRYLWLAAAASLVFAGGCMRSEPMPPGQMDQLWRPSPPQWTAATPAPIPLAEGRRYARIELEYEPSPIWCVIGLHDLAVALPQGDTLRVPLSTLHARAAVMLLERLAKKSHAMAAASADASRQPQRWATTTADLLWQFHVLAASVSQSAQTRGQLQVDDTAAWVVLPLLELLAGRQAQPLETPEAWIDELAAAERRLSEVVLLASLRLTGRALSDDLVDRVLRAERDSPRRLGMRRTRDILLEYFRATPPRFEPLRHTATDAAAGAQYLADGLENLRRMVHQWPRVNRLAFELRRYESHPVAVLEFDIRPGEQVVFSHLDLFAPDVIFRGQGRVEVQWNPAEGAGKVIRFESAGNSGVKLRFPAFPFVLARLLAFPLENAMLKEIRYQAREDGSGTILEVMMEAVHGGSDPRRLLRIETTSTAILADRPALPPRLDGRTKTQTVSFYNGRRRWFITGTSSGKPELWRETQQPPAPEAGTTP